jgi:hypothetical protein
MDQITRVREVVWHWLAAGDRERAADTLLADRELAARSGGAGEFESLLDALGDQPRRRADSRSDVTTQPERTPLDPERARALAALRIEIAVRGGRYTEAFERASASPGAVSPLIHAELTLASGDAATARRALTGLLGSSDASERARAVAMLAELELLAGKPEASAAHLATLGDLSTAEPLARARVHLAAARLDEYEGRVAAMRSALARAHGACKSVPVCLEASELSAVVDARRAIGLAREGRLVEATTALDAADAARAISTRCGRRRGARGARAGGPPARRQRPRRACCRTWCAPGASAAMSSGRCAPSSTSPSSRSCAASPRSPPSWRAPRWRRACAASSATSPRAAARWSPRST